MAGGSLWSQEETHRLYQAIEKFGRQWQKVADYVGTKTRGQCQGKVQFEVRTGRLQPPEGKQERSTWKTWSEKELLKLYLAVRKYGRNWIKVSEFVGTMNNEQCRQRVIKEVKAGRMKEPTGKFQIPVTKIWSEDDMENHAAIEHFGTLDDVLGIKDMGSNTSRKRARPAQAAGGEEKETDEEVVKLRELVNEQNLAEAKSTRRRMLTAALKAISAQKRSKPNESDSGGSGNLKYEQALEQALLTQMLLNEALIKAAPAAATIAATNAGLSSSAYALHQHMLSKLDMQRSPESLQPSTAEPDNSGEDSHSSPRDMLSGLPSMHSLPNSSN